MKLSPEFMFDCVFMRVGSSWQVLTKVVNKFAKYKKPP